MEMLFHAVELDGWRDRLWALHNGKCSDLQDRFSIELLGRVREPVRLEEAGVECGC